MNEALLDREEFRDHLDLALIANEGQFPSMKLRFDRSFPDFEVTPDKPYFAKTVVPAIYNGREEGKLVVVAFRLDDGTGKNNKKYAIGNVTISDDMVYNEKPDRVVPRPKDGVVAEICFPMFSTDEDLNIVPYAIHLEELTVDSKRNVVPLGFLGQDEVTYLDAIDFVTDVFPQAQLTVGYLNGRRVGDPHAIHYNGGTGYARGLQVAGFLAIEDKNSPLIRLISDGHIGFPESVIQNL